ncbi:MAG TPA: alpha/beta hydrolase [Candidatus Acidoferrales bacterium]|nr:alpha/beta hydrolase [Candidatus Acidoferrales bacterium]
MNPKDQAWRNWPVVRIEREYSPSRCVPSAGPFLAEYEIRSRKAEQLLACQKDLRWGDRLDETLDFFPAASRDAPLLVFIHGGYWQELSKNESLFAAADCIANGIAFAAINYTLAPLARVETIVDQCRRAVAWLHRRAGVIGFDSGRLYLSGSSAGGHLAAMMLAKGWQHTAGVSDDAIAGAVLLSGIYDLEPLVGTNIAAPLHLTTADAVGLSPIRLPLGRPLPTIIAWGENETSEFKRQSGSYASRLESAGFSVSAFEVAGANHFDIVLDLADPATALGRATLELIGASAPK